MRCGMRVHVRMRAAGFRVGGAVRHVRLAGNHIGDSGAAALAAVVQQMPSLTSLRLGGTAMPAHCRFLLWGLARLRGRARVRACVRVCVWAADAHSARESASRSTKAPDTNGTSRLRTRGAHAASAAALAVEIRAKSDEKSLQNGLIEIVFDFSEEKDHA